MSSGVFLKSVPNSCLKLSRSRSPLRLLARVEERRAGTCPCRRRMPTRHRDRPAHGGGLASEAEGEREPRHPERREPERDRAERAHVRDDAGALGRVGEGRSDQAPERHVAHGVGEAPQEVADAEEDELAGLGDVGDREQQRRTARRPARPRTGCRAASCPTGCASCRRGCP